METYIYKNITELKTPVGYFYVSDGKEDMKFEKIQ